MELTAGLAAKVLGGLGALGVGGTGIYFLHDYKSNEMTRFDSGLIQYLNQKGNDVVFTVQQGSSDIDSSNFPDFGSTDPVKITVKVTASTSDNNNLKGEGTGKDINKESLQKLNKSSSDANGTAWTWECILEFKKEGTGTTLKNEEKVKIFDSTSKGLLGTLKEDVSTKSKTDDSQENKWKNIKETKENFIRKCALERTRSKNKEINGKDSLAEAKISAGSETVEKEKILFELETSGTDLTFKNKSKFKYWFE